MEMNKLVRDRIPEKIAPVDMLRSVYQKKHEQRGGFREKVFLVRNE